MSFKIYKKESGEWLVEFHFKLGHVEEQLFVVTSMNFYKNESFMVDV